MRPLHPARASVGMLLLALGAIARPAAAQVVDSVGLGDTLAVSSRWNFEVAAITGYQWFDESSALRNAPTLGFRVTTPRLYGPLTIGLSGSYVRPTTRGDYFPWNRQIYFSDQARRNDTTLVFEVSQRVGLAHVGLEAGARFGGGERVAGRIVDWRAMTFDAAVGIGAYGIWLDPEQVRRNARRSGGSYMLGAGIGVPVGGSSTIRLRVDDLIFTDFDRDWFNLHDPLFAEELFPNPEKTPPAKEWRIHNPRLSVQFTFVPGVAR